MTSIPLTAAMSGHAGHFSFLQLPGELRNKVYREVLDLKEPRFMRRVLPRTECRSPEKLLPTSWTLTQVSKQLRYELLPLLHPTRSAAIALEDLADYIQTFYAFRDAGLAVAQELRPSHQVPMAERFTLFVSPSRNGFHTRIPATGVDLLPIVNNLEYIRGVDIGVYNCVFKRLPSIILMLQETLPKWRSEICTLGIRNIVLHDANSGIWKWPFCIAVKCTVTKHTSKKKRVLGLCAWMGSVGLHFPYSWDVRSGYELFKCGWGGFFLTDLDI